MNCLKKAAFTPSYIIASLLYKIKLKERFCYEAKFFGRRSRSNRLVHLA